jgi:hypothetical protein
MRRELTANKDRCGMGQCPGIFEGDPPPRTAYYREKTWQANSRREYQNPDRSRPSRTRARWANFPVSPANRSVGWRNRKSYAGQKN